MTPPYPNSPAPGWYRQAQWKGSFSKRNGVHYVGDEIVIDMPVVASSYDTFKRTATFENGTNGVTLSTTNPRGFYSPFDGVTGSPAYSNTHAASGSTLSAKIPTGADQFFDWGYPAATTDEFGRLYLYATAFPGALPRVTTSGQNWSICVSATGKPTLVDGGANQYALATSIALDQWVRMEWHANYTTDDLELKLFNNPDSATPTETRTETSVDIAASSTSFRAGNHSGGNWGTDYWLDNLVTRASSYPGPYDPNEAIASAVTYTIRDFYGTIVSTGMFDEYQTWFIPTVPAGGWLPGWYRVYLTGSQSDANFANSYGATNFCVIRSDSHFVTMPAASTPDGSDSTQDLVMKGVMGMGTSRITVSDAASPNLSNLTSDIAITKTYWTSTGNPDTQRPTREPWVDFPGGSVDFLTIPGDPSGTYGRVYAKDGTFDGSQVFVTVSAGTNPSTDKITIHHPNAGTLVETWDNLVDNDSAETTINASSAYVKFFSDGANEVAANVAQTAIGKSKHDGVVSVVSTLYPDCKYYEGPENEPPMNAETAHKMLLFADAVHDGNASAKAIGPSFVDILDLSGWGVFLTAGGGSHCDEISFHAYNAVTNGHMNLGKSTIQAFLDLLASHGLQSKPLWQTESVHGFTPVYGAYHPRRARKPLMETLLFEQKGVPRERNNQWYDVSHGFWNFPSWIENVDGSLEPQAVLTRVLAEETWGKPFIAPLDFGTPANSIFLGNLYRGTAGSTIALMTTSFIDGASVTLSIGGTNGPVNVVDGFGRVTSTSPSQGRVQIPLTEVPSYLELPPGATAVPYRVNDWPLTGTGASISPSASTKEIDGVSFALLADDGYLTNYANGTGSAPASPWATIPSVIRLLWTSRTIERVIVWVGPAWQNSGTFITFDVDTTTDGTNWTTRRTISKPALSSFNFGTDSSNSGCFVETYWDEQWIFDVKLPAPVTCTGVRLNVTAASYGGEPLSAPDFGQGNSVQAFRIEEVGAYPEVVVLGTPVVPRGRGAA